MNWRHLRNPPSEFPFIANITGVMDDNIVDYFPSISSEFECSNECRNTSGCNFYTFYLEGDPHHGACFLLTKIIEPIEECTSCLTGAMDCENFDSCGFIFNDKEETHMVFTEPNVEVELKTIASILPCQLRVLAIGRDEEGI